MRPWALGTPKLRKYLLSVLVTIGIVSILLTQISLGDLYRFLIKIDLFWALAGFGCYLVSALFRGLRYRWLVHSKEIPLFDLVRIAILYNLAIMILPSRLGELSYPYLLYRSNRVNMMEGFASLIASRVYDFFIILIVLLFSSFAFQSFFRIGLPFVIVLFVLLIASILVIFFYMDRTLPFVANLVGNIPRSLLSKESPRIRWVQRKIYEIAEDFQAIKARKTYLPVTLTSFLSWLMAFLMFFSFLRGFGISVTFMETVFGSSIAVVANALPISGIGNWGVLEAGWTAGFLVVGLSKAEAIATGFGVHIMIFMISAVLGLFCWVTSKQ